MLELTLRAGGDDSAKVLLEVLELKDLVEGKAVYSVTAVRACDDGIRRAAEGGPAKYALLPLGRLDWDVDVVGLLAM
jgi:hypothetical protein